MPKHLHLVALRGFHVAIAHQTLESDSTRRLLEQPSLFTEAGSLGLVGEQQFVQSTTGTLLESFGISIVPLPKLCPSGLSMIPTISSTQLYSNYRQKRFSCH